MTVADVVVVSNRGPLSFRLDEAGRPVRAGSGGGLAATLRPLLLGTGATWVAAAMNDADRLASEAGLMAEPGLEVATVDIEPDVYRMAYDIVSNATLWFCHHHLFDLPRRPRFDRRWREAWEAYRQYNQQFADAVTAAAPPDAVVLVQDYHLGLTGAMLADSRPDLVTVHFSHTPFADPSVLRTLPSAAAGELLAGMAGFAACGFHTERWAAAFRACFADPELAAWAGTSEPPRCFASPLGPDPEALWAEASSPACAVAGERLAGTLGDRRVIVRVDRIELSKNILRGFWAYEELLETHPEWRGTVVLLALAYTSRVGLAEYLAYRSEIEHTAARINDAWGTPEWTPIVLEVADDRERSMAALRRYDVLLVNPVRDGLNLVAKEGPVVNTTDGVVVLSREAGAWVELRDAVVGVNPFDITDTAEGLHRALSMGPEERRTLAEKLRGLVLGQRAADWLAQQLAVADKLRA